METILSLASTKAAAAPSSDDASEAPISTSSAEQFQTVMERMTGAWNEPASSNKAGIARSTSLGARPSKNGDHRKSGWSKTQTLGSKSSHHTTQPPGDSTAGANSPNHSFISADTPALLTDNILGIESAIVSIQTPATPAVASPTKTGTTAGIEKVGAATDPTPKAGMKSVRLPANVPAGVPSAKLSAAAGMKTALANSHLQNASAANDAETSALQTAVQSDATSIPTTGKSAVPSKSLQPDGIQIQQIQLVAPITSLPSGKGPVGLNSVPSAQQPIVIENGVKTSTLQTAVQSNATNIPTRDESAILSKSLQRAGILIQQTQLGTPVASPPSGKGPVGLNSIPSTQEPIVAEELQPVFMPTQEFARTDSTTPLAVPSTVDVFESGIEPPVPEEPSAGKISLQKGDGSTDSTPSASSITAAKTANSPTAPVLSTQTPSSPAGKNLPPGQFMPVPAATVQTGGPNPAAPTPTAHVIAESNVHSPAPQVPMPSALPAGTTVAQQQMTMKMGTKQNEFAGAVEQKLPGKAVLPAPSGSNPAALASQPQDSSASAMSATGATSSVTAEINSAGVANSSPIVTSPAQTIQRTQDLMAMQIIQMRETGTDSLRVVIKPDAGLQLSLQLQQHNGGIEVQARVDRGDYNLLNQHWPELQQQFESRGIRVAPLSNGETFFGGGGEGFRQPSHSQGQFSDEEAFPAMTGMLSHGYPPTATAKSASASTTLSRRWETWA